MKNVKTKAMRIPTKMIVILVVVPNLEVTHAPGMSKPEKTSPMLTQGQRAQGAM